MCPPSENTSLDASNFSLFSQEGEVTSPLISGPAWTLRLQFTKYQQSYDSMKIFKKIFYIKFHLQFISGALNYTGATLCATSCYLPRAYNAALGGALVDISIRNVSMMAARMTILKLLSAPKQQIRGGGNLMEDIGAAWRFRIAKMVPFWYSRWPPWQPSRKFSNHICSRTEVWLSFNKMGGIKVLWKFRIAKIVLFQYPRWPSSWNSSNHISFQTVCQIESKFDGRHQGA